MTRLASWHLELVLGMGQSVGLFGLVGMLSGLANISSTGSMAIALATRKAWLQAINTPSPKLGSESSI